ncbi:acyltransferase [Paenibacillus humicola]|uniref:acyltransferase n=1 Tax=Paenibacillus humicola TaxID=3110540 RepID=UPI00237B1205|nr:acyltransferase [Paenibacillus humicola]
MRKTKIEEIETLRGFAFLAVVMQHAVAHYFPLPDTRMEDGVLFGLLLLLAKFAVPLFVFITGMVLFYNYDEKIRYGTFIRKRCRDVLLPYVPWAVLYAAEFQHLDLTRAESWPKLGLMVLTGKASYHLWYIVMVFQFYLAFPFVQRLVIRLKPSSPVRAAAALAVFGMLYLWLMHSGGALYRSAAALHLPVVSSWFTTYLDRNALMYTFYFALGAAAGLYADRWRRRLDQSRFLLGALFAAAVGVMLYDAVSRFQTDPRLVVRFDQLALLRPVMAVFLTLSVCAVYALALLFDRSAPAFLRKAVVLAGSYSYVAYLAHAYVLKYTEQLADRLLPGGSVTVRTIAAFAFCAAGSVLLAVLIRMAYRRIKALVSSRTESGGKSLQA